MNQNDQFPTSALPCLKSIVRIEVLPLTTQSHFPFPNNTLPSCLSLLSCLLSLKLSLLYSVSEISKLTQSLHAINHHPRYFYQTDLQVLLTSHYPLVYNSSHAYRSKNQVPELCVFITIGQAHFTFLALFCLLSAPITQTQPNKFMH